MDILNALKQLRDDIKAWVTINLNALNAKIDEKTIPIDNELDSTSMNPVQNQAIAKEINSINDRVGTTSVSTQISQAISKVPTFSGDYNDLINAPNISEDDSGNMIIADESGNIIFKADADGIHTTAVSLNGEAAASEKYVDEAIANINIPEADFTGYATETYVDNKVADLVNSAPEALNTLGELATALENHEDAYDALLETVGDKATHADLENLKEELSESITAETNEWKVVDESGNIIFSVDADGAHTTSLSLNGESVEDIIDTRVASLVDSAPETLNTLNELASALGDDPNFATTVATQIGGKVDKIEGKGLSTNDFTDEYKTKLDGLENIEFEETDPTVPAWAKEATKPTYTAEEVGALSDATILADLTDDETHRTVTDVEKQIWNNKSNFTGDYNDLTNAPNMYEDNSGNLVIADNDGNIIFRSDANGFETTQLITDVLIVNGKNIEEAIHDKPEIATDEEIMEMFIQEDIVPIVTDADGSILTDEHGNILLW